MSRSSLGAPGGPQGLYTLLEPGLVTGVHPEDVDVRSFITDAAGVLDGELGFAILC
jgi:hypothetical protein